MPVPGGQQETADTGNRTSEVGNRVLEGGRSKSELACFHSFERGGPRKVRIKVVHANSGVGLTHAVPT